MELRLIYVGLFFASFLFSIVSSTHFAYGTYQWDLLKNDSTGRQYRFQIELAFRQSFPWPTPYRGPIPPQVDKQLWVGSLLSFYPMASSGVSTVAAPYTFLIELTDKVNYNNDDWFAGTQQVQLNIGTGTSTVSYLNKNFRHYYASCCRLSSIRDTNNDTPWTLTGVINRFASFSPRITGLPRIWFSLNAPNLYTIPVINPSNIPVRYLYASGVESTLNFAQPRKPAPVAPYTITTTTTDLDVPNFRLNTVNGDCTWTPQQTGLYAIGFIIEEICESVQSYYGQTCQGVSPPAVPSGGTNDAGGQGVNKGNSFDSCCTRVPFDFIIQVVPDCNVTIAALTGCLVPPYFYMPFAQSVPPAWRQWNFTRGIQGHFDVCARNDDQTQTDTLVDHSIYLSNMQWVQEFPGNPACYYFGWTPSLTDVDQYVCYFATSIPNGAKSIGQYCIKLHIIDGTCKQISGIIRDFHYYHHNFGKDYSDAMENGTMNFVIPQLSPAAKPECKVPGSGTALVNVNCQGLQTSPSDVTLNQAQPEGFYDWYVTDDATKAAPRNMQTASQQLFCSGVNSNSEIFTFLQSAFFPIDSQLFGNEVNPITSQPFDHNYFFTYEVNTYITYNKGDVFNLRSDDDLWVFIDGVLPTALATPKPTASSNWNLYGIKTDDTTQNPPIAKGFSIIMDTFVAGHPIGDNETVRCDIFYANRKLRYPYLQIEIPNTTLCDALSASDFLFNFVDFSSNSYSTTFKLDASSSNVVKRVTTDVNGAQKAALQLTDRTTPTPFSYSAMWYAVNGVPAKVKASHGFILTFSFVVKNSPTNGPDGFSVVLSQKLTQGAGPNIGYGGTSDNLAIEFDMSKTAALYDPVVGNQTANSYSEVSVHYVNRPAAGFTVAPPFDVNSAYEAGSSSGLVPGAVNNANTSQPTAIALNMQNGTVHNVRIEYSPAPVDTSNASNPVYLPGWLRVFMGTSIGATTYRQLRPVVETQLSGYDMNNILQGSCYLGIAAGLSTNQVADIFITSINFKFVPTDPRSTKYLQTAQNLVAGEQKCVTIQAMDACKNPITVGGEADSITATYTPDFCQKVPVTMPVQDNQDGTYTMCYSPVIKGPYRMDILWDGIAIDQGLLQKFQVFPAQADPANTFAIFGELPECFNSAVYCVGPYNGSVFVARIDSLGHLSAAGNPSGTYGKVFDFRQVSGWNTGEKFDGGVQEFINYVSNVPTSEYLLIATSGDFSTATMVSNIKLAANSIKPAPTAMKNFAAGDVYAYIGSQSTLLINSSCGSTSFCESKSASGTAMVTARGRDPSIATQVRLFSLKALAANQGCGPYARVNSVYDDHQWPAGVPGIFSVVAKDKYGNLCDAEFSSLSPPRWNPDFTLPSPNRPPGTLAGPSTDNNLLLVSVQGYYQYQFLSYRAGSYQVNVLLRGTDINGSYYTVVITPGLANVYTSSGTGLGVSSATAGFNSTFLLNLNDKVNNTIARDNPLDNITGTLYQLDGSGNVVKPIKVTLEWIDDSVSGCKACILKATYNATVATTATTSYRLNFTMNGDTATYGLPNVVPGPLYPPTCTFDFGPTPLYNPAGTPVLFTIQAKDRFNNLRTIPNVVGDSFGVATNLTASGPIGVAYAGSGGIYNVNFKPKYEGALVLSIQVVATGADPYLAQGTYVIGTKTLNIVAGPAENTWSYLANVPTIPVIAGVFFNYNIYSYDEFGNFRDNQPFNYPVAYEGDYVPRSYIPPAGDAVTVTVDKASPFFYNTGIFNIITNATKAGYYTISVLTGSNSTNPGDVTGTAQGKTQFKSPYASVQVVPAPTWPAKTIIAGPGQYGGKVNATAWFTLTAFDLYDNQIADWHDNVATKVLPQNPNGQILYTVQISGVCRNADSTQCIGQAANPTQYTPITPGTITNTLTPGVYNVTYTVPTNDISDFSPWNDFNITVSHSGGGVTTPYFVGPWSIILPAHALIAPQPSCAKIFVADGTAGTESDWNITDLSCVSPFPEIYTTPSFLVTLTQIVPNTGDTISPIKTVCLLSGCGTSGVQNSKFNVSFTPTVLIGTFKVRVFAYGSTDFETAQSVAGITVNIGPGPVWPPSCSVASFPGTTMAGVPYTFTVALADQWNHPIGSGKTVSAIATGPSKQVIPLTNATWSGSNYSFTTEDKLTEAGSWNIKIYEETSRNLPNIVTEIGGKLLTLTVTPARVSPVFTYATFPDNTLPGPNQIPFSTAGQISYFTVYPKDQYGNDLPYPDIFTGPDTAGDLSASDNGAGFVAPNGKANFTWQAQPDPQNPSNLIFSVAYNATKIMSPTNDVDVLVKGTRIQGTNNGTVPGAPFSVVVTPAQISSTLSQVTPIPASAQVVAGNPLQFRLDAVDIWNNAWLSGQAGSLNALIQMPSSSGGTATQQASVDDLNGGSYLFTLTDTSTASNWNGTGYKKDYVVSLEYSSPTSSQTLTGSGGLKIPAFTVIAGPTDPTQTTINPSPFPLIANTWRNYTVTTVDKFGNRRYLGTDDVVNFLFYRGNVDCSFDNTAPTDATNTFVFPQSTKGVSLGQGTYTVNFTGTIAGIYTLNITVANPTDGVPLGYLTCPQVYKLIQQVLPGPAYPPKCWYTINPCDVIPAGGKLDFFMQINDKWGNNILRSGTQWAMGLFNAPGAVAIPGYTLADALKQTSDVDLVQTLPPGWATGHTPAEWLTPQTTPYDNLQHFTPPEPVITIKDFDNSSYSFTVQVFKSGLAGIVVSAVDALAGPKGTWIAIPPPLCFNASGLTPFQSTITITPGGPRQFYPQVPPIFQTAVSPTSFTAAIPSEFTLQAKDFYGNNITTDTHYYQIVATDLSNNNGYSMNVYIAPDGTVNGVTTVRIESAWHGNFSLSITLFPNSTIPGADNTPVSPPVKNVYVQHATCAFPPYGSLAEPYRCPNRDCVAKYTDCPSLNGDTCTGSTPIFCGDKCVAKASDCGYCSGMTICDDASCTVGTCPVASKCASGVSCPVGDYCRASLDDCPSPVVCAPGYMTCPDGRSCARNLTGCDASYKTLCPAGTSRCSTGGCARTLDDCPTPVSCGAGLVLCGTDGSCQKSRDMCPDQYFCYDETPLRCASGVCVSSLDQCPPSVTCFPGFVKCPNGKCATSVSQCCAGGTTCDSNAIMAMNCPLTQVRCPDGSCTHNMLFCGSLPTCPAANPLLCWDGSCVQYNSECSYPQACPHITCPGGACSANLTQCPTLTRCPDDHPILCSDRSCQIASEDCPQVPTCPIQTPNRCPDGQSCRAQLSDCPSLVTCQAYQVKCSDGTCAVAADKCAPYENSECLPPMKFCPGGECLDSLNYCPTHVTCPSGYAKCPDGSCHDVCPVSFNQCDLGLVTCPQASAGIQCAPDLASCPVSFICPFPTTVRCVDSTCATTAQDCPTPPKDADFVTNKVPCADGTWAADQQSCPTPITCPTATPYKCFDGTCRIDLADCPVPTPCALVNNVAQYRCSNGACSQFPWDPICTSAATPCPVDKPYQCSTTNCPNALDCCVANKTDCDDTTKYPNPITDCTSGKCPICAPGWYYCQSGSCVRTAIDCEAPLCPASLPYRCDDGLCTDVKDHCNAANGCPWNKPTKCPQGGFCLATATASECQGNATAMGIPSCTSPYPTLCSDGSCAKDSTKCNPSSGCKSPDGTTQLIKCFDGSCAEVCVNPTPSTTTDPVNTCPSSFSVKCPDGFCAKSLSACPYPLVDANCSGSFPFQCAIGTCVVSSVQCPPVYPCAQNYIRCGDGSCRPDPALDPTGDTPTCPLADTCPKGSTRCNGTTLGSGLCTTDQSLCSIGIIDGCPAGLLKCPSGQCASNLATNCSVLPNATGCAAGYNKCPSGSCLPYGTQCPLPDGCLAPASRCPFDSACVTDAKNCLDKDPSKTQCGDGSWVANGKDCNGKNGCPVLTPFRCANGNCSAASAIDGGCPPTSTCDSTQKLCADGSCVSQTTSCPALPPCNKHLCSNFKCMDVCPTTNKYCPSDKSPLLCPDGTCADNLAKCKSAAGGLTNQNCPSPRYACIDQICVDFPKDCIQRALDARPGAQGLEDACQNGCMCPDGSCRSSSRECGIIPRCPFGQFRCPNGECVLSSNQEQNPCSTHQPATKCGSGYNQCEDGYCRKQCLEYDGCGLKYPFHCTTNRECGGTSKGCANAGLGNPTISAKERRLLQSSSITTPCLPEKTTSGFCMAMVKASLTTITVDTTKSSSVAIALDPNTIPRLTLVFSSGSFVLKDGGTITGVGIRPVGESRMRYAINEVHASRKIQFGSFLPFSTTVLSPAFECEVDSNVYEPFNINVTVNAYYDRRPDVNASDICLARLVELPGFTTWRCLFPDPKDRDVNGTYYVRKRQNLPIDQIESVINRCTPETSADTGVQSTANATAYAFIWSPIAKTPQSPEGPDVIQRNIVWIILGVLLGIAGLVLLTYCAFRLYRYRNKYKEQKEEADRLQEEVENMRQFGGEAGNKDDQVNMTANPLAVQLKDVQAKFNEEDLKLQQAESDLRKQEGEIRQEHIRNMRENRDQLATQLEKLKRQLAETQAAQQPKATYEEDNQGGASYATDEPVREEFDAGQQTGGAQPRKQKRDL